VPAPLPEGPTEAVLQNVGAPTWLAPLLARRGVIDAESARRFLHPSLDQLHDPLRLFGMAEALDRLMAARARGEKVAIVGDYDVDGVTATAILRVTLQACGIAAEPILPNRLTEGYGFQEIHAERARDLGCGLILTADCGSSARSAVERALALGLGVLVTDHHLPGGELPAGAIQVNPRQAGCTYPFPHLAAVGIAFKLALALAARCGRAIDPAALLRVACLGTITDLVPLLGENRVIAALGLAALPQSRSVGLQALIRQSGLKPPFSAADVGFRLGPRLNASGRLASADESLELLLSRDPERARVLAEQLDRWNRERQGEELRVVEEATRRFAARRPLPAILVDWDPAWHKGVVGIAAGRIAKEFHRPTLLLAVEGETATGSGRSVPAIDLHGFLDPWKPRMERFGGHTQAVGLTARHENLAGLRGEWEEAAASWPAEQLAWRHVYEIRVTAGELAPGFVAALARLEPFGQGNPQPLLRVGPLELAGKPRLFGNGHLAVRARGDDGAAVELLGWRWQARQQDLAGRFEVLGYVERDNYTGGSVLRLVDARPAEAGAD
jgi:single-stranded-DNA-specific exonuclease